MREDARRVEREVHLGQPLFVRLNSDRGEDLLHVGGGDLVLSHGAEQSSSDVTHGELLSR